MLHTETLRGWIASGLECVQLDVDGDGHHFSAVIVSKAFEGQPRVRRQQLVNAILKPHFDSGELHALSMQTLTPEEWQSRG